jgi:acyl-CoA thioesterase
MSHPFAELLALELVEQSAGHSRCELEVGPQHLNPHAVVHGAVLFALADTGMGAALYPTLQPGESCATIEIKISFLRAVRAGRLVCTSTLVHRGRTLANLQSTLALADAPGVPVATANGNFAIFARREPQAAATG